MSFGLTAPSRGLFTYTQNEQEEIVKSLGKSIITMEAR